MFKSSTRDIPPPLAVPRHVAIIMDGNGRWSKQRLLPRVAGHHRGVEAVRNTVRAAIERGVEIEDLPDADRARLLPELTKLSRADFARALTVDASLARRNALGGTSPTRVQAEVQAWKKTIASWNNRS